MSNETMNRDKMLQVIGMAMSVCSDARYPVLVAELLDLHKAVGALCDEAERFRRAVRPATAETFESDVAEYEAKLAQGGAA